MSALYIKFTGKIVRGGEIQWNLASLPQVPQLGSDEPDSTFDAPPVNGFSFFEHLMLTTEEDAATQELVDGRDDEQFWAGGSW